MTNKRLSATIATLLIFLFIGSPVRAKTIPLPDLMKPASIAADAERLYISDGTTVHVYSRNDFKLEKTFGKKGEGPQEFMVHSSHGVDVLPQTKP